MKNNGFITNGNFNRKYVLLISFPGAARPEASRPALRRGRRARPSTPLERTGDQLQNQHPRGPWEVLARRRADGFREVLRES